MKRHLNEIDVAKTKMSNAQRLDQVGMNDIECPVIIKLNNQIEQMSPGRADAYVSLDEPQKGIHMSRLFLTLTETLSQQPISPKIIQDISDKFLKSHEGISQSAQVKVQFELMLKRPALLSANEGWRSYPISIWSISKPGQKQMGVDITIKYSSTCPCSAALARQLIQEKFKSSFAQETTLSTEKMMEWLGKEESIAGTPHGQRSEGHIRLILASALPNLDFIVPLIDDVERAITTPVQAAVKREDEQEFARLNAANLMFAEDAVRRISAAVRHNELFLGTSCHVSHLESLHPHNAVARVATGQLAALAWI
jgi:GTP cyclohydrolase IB